MEKQKRHKISKWLWSIIIVLVVITGIFGWYYLYSAGKQVISTPATSSISTAGWKTYNSDKVNCGISFRYPTEWILSDNSQSYNGKCAVHLYSQSLQETLNPDYNINFLNRDSVADIAPAYAEGAKTVDDIIKNVGDQNLGKKNIGGKDFIEFYSNWPPSHNYILQRENNLLEINSYDGKTPDYYNQILSTFQFN